MNAAASSRPRLVRRIMSLLLIATVLGPLAAVPVLAADPSPAASSLPPSPDPAAAMCESVGDLRLYVGFLRDQSLDEDGLLPILVGAAASLAEARTLAGLVGETYRPLVDAMVVALQDLEASLRGFRDEGTIGSGLVELGQAITGVGLAMDALAAALREPCPVPETIASPAPMASASPAA